MRRVQEEERHRQLAQVEVYRHVYSVSYGGLPDVDVSDSGNGLVNSDGHAAYVATGTESGPLLLRYEVLPAAPERIDTGYDEVAEASISSAGLSLEVNDLNGITYASVELPSLGTYRLRVHARGRDRANEDVITEEPVEEHLLQLWPAAR